MLESEEVYGWAEQTPETPPAVMAGYMRLAVEVVIRAAGEAAENTPEGHQARAWLLSEDADLYLQVCGITRYSVESWIRAGALFPERKGKRENQPA